MILKHVAPKQHRQREIPYYLRPRRHNLVLSTKNNLIVECDFITQMLYKDAY